MFDRIHGQSQMFCNFLVCPVPARQHGNGIFQGTQKIRHCLLHLGIVNLHPSTAECKYTIYQLLVHFRLFFPDTDFQNSLKQTVILDKWFHEFVKSCPLPCLAHRLNRLFLFFQIDLTHCLHTAQIDHGDRVNSVCHQKCTLHNTFCLSLILSQINLMRQKAHCK